MQKFNVTRKKVYQSGGAEKVVWLQVGQITEFDNGGMILEMNDRAETYNIFPIERRQEPANTEQQMTEAMEEQPPMPDDEIKIENIPF